MILKTEAVMHEQHLKSYLVSYVNAQYEYMYDQIVFAYDEAQATKILLETNKDSKFILNLNQWLKTSKQLRPSFWTSWPYLDGTMKRAFDG